jgi:hypothetical protein
MSLAVGPITQNSVGANSDSLACAAATGGVGPYTYQWYRSLTTGFTPGAGSLISGATSLSLNDSGLVPNTVYYYKVRVTDTGNGNATADSAQLAVTTTATQLNPNQFAQAPIVGMIDMRFDYDTIAVQIDSTQSTPLYAGSAVKFVDSADGIPKVVGCTADSDECAGFINFDIKSVAFNAGDRAEISQSGNVIYLYATEAIARGAQCCLDTSVGSGAVQAAGHTGKKVVGWAFDKASSAGQLIRVKLVTPSFATA